MSINLSPTSSLHNNTLNTLLSWFNHIAYSEIESKYKDCSDMQKLIFNIERYYSKYRPKVVSKATEEQLTTKLKLVQKEFEDLITLKDSNNQIQYNNNGDIRCIDYSPQLLTMTALDYLVNVNRDLSLRLKFSHIDFNSIFEDVEKKDSELFYSTMKIYNKLVGML